MKIIEKIIIESKSDLLYLKYRLYKMSLPNESGYIFAAMELGTNILKYAQKGYVLLLQEGDFILLAFCDNGPGIDSLEKAKQKGYTTHTNSLGLGLYQLEANNLFLLDIFTSTSSHLHGTVALVIPIELDQQAWYLSRPFLSEEHNGDFFAKKGKFLLFGDASGHNKKSYKSARFIVDRFFHTPLSCLMAQDFFEMIHQELQKRHLRSAVFSLIEMLKNHVQICGVGNIDIWHLTPIATTYHSLRPGIVGESLSTITNLSFSLEKKDKIVLCTDGIQKTYAKEILDTDLHPATMAVALIHFCADPLDDASTLIIRNVS